MTIIRISIMPTILPTPSYVSTTEYIHVALRDMTTDRTRQIVPEASSTEVIMCNPWSRRFRDKLCTKMLVRLALFGDVTR